MRRNEKQAQAVFYVAVAAIAAVLIALLAATARANDPAAKNTAANDAAAKNSAKDRAADDTAESKDDSAAPEQKEDPLVADLRDMKKKLDEVMPVFSAIADPEFRKEDGPKVSPLLQKSADLLMRLATREKDDAERLGLERDRCQYLGMLAALGDDHAATTLEKLAVGDSSRAVMAKSAVVLGKWWRQSKDAEAQEKILADYTAVAKSNPKNDNVVLTLAVMATIGPANDDLSIRVSEVLRKVMTTERAKKLAAQLDPSGALRDLLGKPLVAVGRTALGKSLSTADWKGKVVMLDFWATWCGPCNAEIPRMKDIYKTYHPKGLEMVGLDCDGSDDTVNSFIKQKEMPWPQLREWGQSESAPWHPLAMQWGVIGIPTMFLIDKKGVLRYIDTREDTTTKIENLLAE